jgi:hypothetical protein
LDALVNAGVRVVNMSARDTAFTTAIADARLQNTSNLLLVKSAGNAGAPAAGGNSVTNPGNSWNAITVGGLDYDFNARASYSSYNDGNAGARKPDIAAPSEMVFSASARDTNYDGRLNDYNPFFFGSDYNSDGGDPTTGSISGTSFAAPHVSGVVALMKEYQADNANRVDDHRLVYKATLFNGAQTFNEPWRAQAQRIPWDQRVRGQGTAGNPLEVTESLDREFGVGVVSAWGALRNLSRPEALASDTNAAEHHLIQPSIAFEEPFTQRTGFWDLETAGAAAQSPFSTVTYMLGQIMDSAMLPGTVFRSTLVWDYDAAGARLADLNLRLYAEIVTPVTPGTPGGVMGFDPTAPNADILLAFTSSNQNQENVKLLNFEVPDLGLLQEVRYYLVVTNHSPYASMYGLSTEYFAVPAPATVLVLASGLLAFGRRRAGGR